MKKFSEKILMVVLSIFCFYSKCYCLSNVGQSIQLPVLEQIVRNALSHQSIGYALTENVLKDVDFKLLSKQFSCLTSLGDIFLASTLINPITPYDTKNILFNRQNIIKKLVKNKKFHQEIKLLVNEASSLMDQINELLTHRAYKKDDGTFQEYKESTNYLDHGIISGFFLFAGVASISLIKENKISANNDGSAGMITFACFGYFLYRYLLGLYERGLLYYALRLIEIAEEIEYITDTHNLVMYYKSSDFEKSQAGKEIRQTLEHNRYAKKYGSPMTITSCVHALAAQIRSDRSCFESILLPIAEMDVYLALAEKIMIQSNTKHQFCFVEFLDQEKPAIESLKNWNITLQAKSHKTIMPFDLIDVKNIIVTGPDKAAKRTVLSTMLQNVLLAQTFGIAAALKFKYTPFHVVYSYMNYYQTESKHQSFSCIEIHKDILSSLKKIMKTSKIFFVADDFFSNFNTQETEARVCNFFEDLRFCPNVFCMYTTHFDKLKSIGVINDSCANYKIEKSDRQLLDNSTMLYPYILRKDLYEIYSTLSY